MAILTKTPQQGPVIPNQSVTTPATAPAPKKREISHLITHISKQDNHLWQALNSLQDQANAIVTLLTPWVSWVPKIYDENSNPIPADELTAYYRTLGPVLYIEIHATLTYKFTASFLYIDLPMDIGETVYKTCAAYLTSATDNGVIGLETWGRKMTITLNPTFVVINTPYKFRVGGSLGIIQGS